MDLNQYARAIASIESAGSGDYQAVGPRTGKGNRAYGRYQVMDFNIGPWTEKYLGQRLTPEQFLASPEAQDAVFRGEFGSYIERYGNPQDAASAWFTGQPLSTGAGRSDILGTTGAGYVEKFNAALGQPQGGNMQPQRLLSTSGQAEPERLPFFQRPETADFFDRLAIGLGGLTLNPNQALIQASQERLSERRKTREATAQRNATVEFLRSRGRDDLADAIQGGLPATDALKLALTPTEKTALMQNVEWLMSRGVPMEDALQAVRSGSVVNVGGPTSPGWEAVDKKFAETWIDWTSGGGADAMKQIAQLRGVADLLATGAPITGPVLGLQPDVLQSLFSPEALDARQKVEEVVQRNLRAVLGAQFTQAEGDRLIARAFDQRLSPQQNAARLSVLIQQMEAAAQAKAAMVNYFGQRGTLQGFESAGVVPTIEDFEATLDALDRRMGVDTRPKPSMSGDDAADILLGD